MGRHNHLKYLKKTKARVVHQCGYCGEIVPAKEYYYKEALDDPSLHLLNARSFCTRCYEQHGDSLLTLKGKKTARNESLKRLNDFLGALFFVSLCYFVS